MKHKHAYWTGLAVGIGALAALVWSTDPSSNETAAPNGSDQTALAGPVSQPLLSATMASASQDPSWRPPETPAPPLGAPPVMKPGIHIMPLDQQPLPAEWKEEKRQQIRNLRDKGSMSGGKVSHEFERAGVLADHLRKNGIEKLRALLGIQPTELGAVLGGTFMIVGADATGKDVEKMGRAGFFQIYRNPTTDQMVEMSELQYDVLSGDGAVITPELHNDQVGVSPATTEELTDERGATLINVQWISKDRAFHLTTRNMPREQARQLAQSVDQGFVAMPFDGWRKLYEYDRENFLHRTARPETERGRW